MKLLKGLFIAAFILVCGLIGCGHVVLPFYYVHSNGHAAIVPTRVYHVWVDREFGVADRLSIDNAIKQWNFALNGYVRIDIETYEYNMEVGVLDRVMRGDGWVILKIDSMNPMVEPLDRGNSGEKQFYTLAWVNAIGGNRMFVIRNRISNTWMEGIIMHEIGHLLGARHDEVYLMQPHYNWEDYRCVDYEALKRVAAFQVIPMSQLNYCQYGDKVQLPH